MPAADRPPVSTIPDGFRLAARGDCARGPHPLARRNGDQVADRLAECSLYRRDLDLAVYAPDGQVAGYGLCWADPVTGCWPGRTDAHARPLPRNGPGPPRS